MPQKQLLFTAYFHMYLIILSSSHIFFLKLDISDNVQAVATMNSDLFLPLPPTIYCLFALSYALAGSPESICFTFSAVQVLMSLMIFCLISQSCLQISVAQEEEIFGQRLCLNTLASIFHQWICIEIERGVHIQGVYNSAKDFYFPISLFMSSLYIYIYKASHRARDVSIAKTFSSLLNIYA